MENCGLWLCTKRTDSYVTFEKVDKKQPSFFPTTIRRKPKQDDTTEGVIADEGRAWKGMRIGQTVLRSYDYKGSN